MAFDEKGSVLNSTTEPFKACCFLGAASSNGDDTDGNIPENRKYNKTLDRHLFSLFCDENFASMDYYIYLITIYKLTTPGHSEKGNNSQQTENSHVLPPKPTLECMLKLWLHDENLISRTMTKRYIRKHLWVVFWTLIFIVGHVIMLSAFWPKNNVTRYNEKYNNCFNV